MPTPLRVALDWTPNTNHTGFYVALGKGWFKEAGVDVILQSADDDGYTTTPCKKILAGSSDIAICPSESALAYAMSSVPGSESKLVSIAALLQRDTSAIVVLDSSSIMRPRDLDGQVYASYSARYEGSIVKALIQADGGTGVFTETHPPKLGVWNTLLSGSADATWVFMGWEGVEAARKGIPLRAFTLDEFGIPYGYTPVAVCAADFLQARGDAVRAFLHASERGFRYAADNPDDAADILRAVSGHPSLEDAVFVRESQRVVSKAYLHSGTGRWGVQEEEVWDHFLQWLVEQSILVDRDGMRVPLHMATRPQDLFTNAFLSPDPSPSATNN